MKYISKEMLESLDISTAEVVAHMERLLALQARGKVWVAPKTNLSTDDDRYMMATLAAADDPPLMVVKALLINPENPRAGLSAINSTITLLDSATGLPVVMMDGNWVTALRTAAASALAARHLAVDDSGLLALVGCGVQAHSHLLAFSELYPLREVRVFGRGAKNMDLICRAAQSLGLKAIACETSKEAVMNADIVVSSIPLVPKIEPFLDATWLKPGVFVSSTDLALPWRPESMRVFDRVIIDDRKQETAMSKPMLDTNLIDGDISELVNGKVAGRSNRMERTAFVFRSVALGDLAVAALAYEKLGENG